MAQRKVKRCFTSSPHASVPRQPVVRPLQGELIPPWSGNITVEKIPHPPETMGMAQALLSNPTSQEWQAALRDRVAPLIRPFSASKEAGLALTLIGVAEAQGRRLSELVGVVRALEAKVFAPEMLSGLTPDQLLGLYELAVSMQDRATHVVAAVHQAIDFDRVRTQIEGLLRAAGVQPTPPVQPVSSLTEGDGGAEVLPSLSGPLATQILHILNTKTMTEQ